MSITGIPLKSHARPQNAGTSDVTLESKATEFYFTLRGSIQYMDH